MADRAPESNPTPPPYTEACQAEPLSSQNVEPGAVPGGFLQRRICGMRIALVLAAVLLLAIVGAVVGGVLGSQKKSKASNDAGTISGSSSATPTATNRSSAGTVDLHPEISHLPFSSQSWYTLGTSGNSSDTDDPWYYSLQAYYTGDSKQSSQSVGKRLPKSSPDVDSQQWWFEEVPASWENGTFSLPSGESWGMDDLAATRTFWLASRKYGPEVRLTADEADLHEVGQRRNASTVYPRVRMKRKDVSNIAQYWFKLRDRCGAPGDRHDCWKFHNVKNHGSFWIGANEYAGWHAPALGSGDLSGWDRYGWDLWTAVKGDTIRVPEDNGFVGGAET